VQKRLTILLTATAIMWGLLVPAASAQPSTVAPFRGEAQCMLTDTEFGDLPSIGWFEVAPQGVNYRIGGVPALPRGYSFDGGSHEHGGYHNVLCFFNESPHFGALMYFYVPRGQLDRLCCSATTTPAPRLAPHDRSSS
jgi:hypothetical protein